MVGVGTRKRTRAAEACEGATGEASASALAADEGARGERQVQREIERCASLEASLAREKEARRAAEARVRGASAAVAAAEAAQKAVERSADAEMAAARAAQRAAEDEAADARRAATRNEARLEARAVAAEAAANDAEERAEAADAEAAEALRCAGRAEAQVARCEAQAARAGDRGDSAREAELEGLVKELRAELATGLKDVDRARSQLDKRHNADLMRERVHSAESAADRAKAAEDAARAEGNELAAKVTTLQDELARWKALLVDVPGLRPEVPEDLPRLISQLQREAAAAGKARGEADAKVAELRGAADALEARATSAEACAKAAEASAADAKAAAMRAEGARDAAVAERDGLRAVVKSFEEEMAAAPESAAAAGGDAGERAMESARAAHTARLEEALAASQARATALDAELTARDEATASARSDATRATEDAATLRAANGEATREIERLCAIVVGLEKRVARGEFNPERTKVLHLAAPPELVRLKAENATLREQLEAAATGGGVGDGVGEEQPMAATPMPKGRGGCAGAGGVPSFTPARTPAAGLRTPGPRYAGDAEARVVELEKFLARYKTVFKDQISAFREACFFLFGYKMDVVDVAAPKGNKGDAEVGVALATKRFTLTSRFAKDASERLVFSYVPGHGMDIVETPYSRSMRMEVDTFLRKFSSIPAFLSNHTMEAFNSATQA